jgi:hypothetical protein
MPIPVQPRRSISPTSARSLNCRTTRWRARRSTYIRRASSSRIRRTSSGSCRSTFTPTGPAAGTSVVISRSSMQQAQPFPFSDANQPGSLPSSRTGLRYRHRKTRRKRGNGLSPGGSLTRSIVISRSSMQQAQPFPFSDANQPDVHPLIDSSGSTHPEPSPALFLPRAPDCVTATARRGGSAGTVCHLVTLSILRRESARRPSAY